MRRSSLSAPVRLALLLVGVLVMAPLAADSASKDAPKTKKPMKAKAASPGSPELAPKDPGPKLQKAPAKSRPGLTSKPGTKLEKQKSQPSKALRPKVQGDGTISSTPNKGADNRLNRPELTMPSKPKINGSGFKPDPSIGGTSGKVFAPGGTVFLLGFHFGNVPGTVHLEVDGSFFPEHGNKIPLAVSRWTDGLVEAKIPKPMTGPLGRTALRIHLETAQGFVSTYDGDFDVPVEKRWLRAADPAIRNVSCEYRADENVCGHVAYTLYGMHEQDWGMDVPLNGGDQWAIHLEDGWVLSKMKKEVEVTGDDRDVLRIPDFPAGKSSWTPHITFKVTADDRVRYAIDVEVKRAKGAY